MPSLSPMSDLAALILAAGRGTRFELGSEASKLVALLESVPLVRHVAQNLIASGFHPIVVTGHARDAVMTALDGLHLTEIFNPDFATGMASSLKAGIAALPADASGVLVALGDMPSVLPATYAALRDAWISARQADAVVPVHAGQRGNPVILSRALFGRAAAITGDQGARGLLKHPGTRVIEVAVDDPAIALDIDTRAALRAIHQSR